ncbi:MAG: hypothetical protein ACXW2A_13095 [Burkholderiales bacterium]
MVHSLHLRDAMQCTLLIPHLFWPGAAAASVLSGLALPSLSKLVARARRERFAALAPEAWLCQAFEVENQQDWPVAALTLQHDGGDPALDYWMRADPVHLRIDRESLMLADASLFGIEQSEADGLVAALNAHFAEDGLHFEARTPKRWYVRLAQRPQLRTFSPAEAASQDVRPHLPQGADAAAWHRVFNEAQMLLHNHAVNTARDARGEPTVNSVWFWGGGTYPRVPGRPFTAVWSNEALALALAAAAEVASGALPTDPKAWLEVADRDAHARHLVVLDELAGPAVYHDADTWRTRMEALDERWFTPLIAALRAGTLGRLAIVAPVSSACWRLEVTRTDLLKFWRTGEPLARYG